MSRQKYSIQHLFGSKAIILLIVLVGLERLIILLPPIAGEWGKSMHWIISISSVVVAIGLVIRYFLQFVAVSCRVLPGYWHLLKSYLGINSRRAPETYVRELFDDYADSFDQHLLKELDYQTPHQIHLILQTEMDQDQRYRILDLGCGTGLCASLFGPISRELVGIDLSEAMLAKAKNGGFYQRLICDSLTRIHAYYQHYFDLVISADVFVYFGELGQVLIPVAKVLKPKGYFAFSVEACENQRWRLNHGGRYAHSRAYVTELANRLRFEVIRVEARTLRSHKGEPVMGDIYVLQALESALSIE